MRLLILLISLFVSSCDSTKIEKYSDEEYSRLMIGTWISEYSYDNGAEISYGEKIYKVDGTAEGFISDRVRLPSGDYREVRLISYESKWRVVDGVLIIWNVLYTPREPEVENEEFRDKIITIANDKAVFEDLDDGTRFVRYRKNVI